MGKAEIGKIFGIPIVLDVTFILLVVLYGLSHFTSATVAGVTYGVALVTGVALSILLHELGHAAAARYYGVPTSAIELNGLGGLCFFARPLPPDRLTNIVVLLAGPAANLLLWLIFAAAGASITGPSSENPYSINRTARLLLQIASINQLLFFFNLLPAHPLDGGRALAQFISAGVGYGRAMRVIAYLGLVIALLLCLASFKGGLFVALIGLVLFQENLSVLQAYKGQQ